MANDALMNAAGRIADGEQVDWLSVSSTLKSDEEREVADELALLARIAAGHRQLHELLPVNADTPPNLMPDRARWGHLDLLNIVGRGAYGTVYRAWDTRLERLVALKLFHGAHDPEAVMQEGRMLARVRHENVVTVYGADIIDGVAGLWMELVHGKTLDQIVKDQGPMEPRAAAEIGVDVARALGAVHGAGLLHCDVKAQNVVRENSGRVVLMDFGAGRVVPEARDSDQLSDVAGTPRYMAPELFHAGAEATKATDIYSFGVLLYYLVSARFPVDGKSLGELKQAHVDGRVTPLRDARTDVPVPYLALVSRALDRDPEKRQPSAADVLAGLTLLASVKVKRITPRSVGLWAAVAVIGLLALALLRPLLPTAAPPVPEIRSIAVLPIRNLTGDTSKAYIAEGLTEVLIANLARIRNLRVKSSASVLPWRHSTESPDSIAKRLGVSILLAGSITEAGPRVRFNLQLIDANGTAVWGEEIERDSPGVVSAQAAISRHVAERLALDTTGSIEKIESQAKLDPVAQDAYLKGLSLSTSGPTLALQSVRLFRQAVEIEPGFAAAWAQLSLAEGRFVDASVDGDRAARAPIIKELAQRAVSLDPDLAIAQAALANAEFYYDWDFTSAEQTFRKSLELDPSNAFARQRLAMLLAALGRTDQAIVLGREAADLEPTLAVRWTNLGILYYYARDYARAEIEMQRALKMDAEFPAAHFGLGRIYLAQGRMKEAAAAFERSLGKGRPSAYLVVLQLAYVAAGRPDDAARVSGELTDRQKQGDGFNLDHLAYIAIAEGRVDDAFKVLEEARAKRMTNMLWIAVDPRVDRVRSDPRFNQLLREMKLRP